jgi:hypothetical protein
MGKKASRAGASCTEKIQDDGSAKLRLDGMVNNPKYAINDAQRGRNIRTASRPDSTRRAAWVGA